MVSKKLLPPQGFTLIELLITISIVAILIVVGTSMYNNALVRSRDALRKKDLRTMATALEAYYAINHRYPCVLTGGSNVTYPPDGIKSTTNASTYWITDAGCTGSPIPFTSEYLSKPSIDPKNNNITAGAEDTTFGYVYKTPNVVGLGNCPKSGEGQYFVLTAPLENHDDIERCELKQNKQCDGTLICSTAQQKYLYVVTSQDNK